MTTCAPVRRSFAGPNAPAKFLHLPKASPPSQPPDGFEHDYHTSQDAAPALETRLDPRVDRCCGHDRLLADTELLF